MRRKYECLLICYSDIHLAEASLVPVRGDSVRPEVGHDVKLSLSGLKDIYGDFFHHLTVKNTESLTLNGLGVHLYVSQPG